MTDVFILLFLWFIGSCLLFAGVGLINTVGYNPDNKPWVQFLSCGAVMAVLVLLCKLLTLYVKMNP